MFFTSLSHSRQQSERDPNSTLFFFKILLCKNCSLNPCFYLKNNTYSSTSEMSLLETLIVSLESWILAFDMILILEIFCRRLLSDADQSKKHSVLKHHEQSDDKKNVAHKWGSIISNLGYPVFWNSIHFKFLCSFFEWKNQARWGRYYSFYSKELLDIILIIGQKVVEIHKTFLP